MQHSSTKPSKRRPNLPLDFKIKLVEQALQSGVSIAGLAREYGIDDPLSGHVFIFRGRSGTQLKLLWSTVDGCAY